ncbi:MAG: outer membrane lipoprotein chaperone LolA [Legionellaceae bacterium]|nr:outer membrane lipoprotein chaperone LolA [Legionellaceae bacterium]
MQVKKICCLFFILGITTCAWAETAGEVLWDKMRHITSMKASFKQKVSIKKRVLSESSGSMALERPGHFRWQTKEPMEQLLIADGKKFWTYDIELEQVTVRQQSEVTGAAAGLFLGDDRTRFFHDFDVTETHQNKREIFELRATAKQANIQRMSLQFDAAELLSMELYDQLGQRTSITFKHVQTNMALAPHLFRFSPPTGVDVVEQ